MKKIFGLFLVLCICFNLLGQTTYAQQVGLGGNNISVRENSMSQIVDTLSTTEVLDMFRAELVGSAFHYKYLIYDAQKKLLKYNEESGLKRSLRHIVISSVGLSLSFVATYAQLALYSVESHIQAGERGVNVGQRILSINNKVSRISFAEKLAKKMIDKYGAGALAKITAIQSANAALAASGLVLSIVLIAAELAVIPSSEPQHWMTIRDNPYAIFSIPNPREVLESSSVAFDRVKAELAMLMLVNDYVEAVETLASSPVLAKLKTANTQLKWNLYSGHGAVWAIGLKTDQSNPGDYSISQINIVKADRFRSVSSGASDLDLEFDLGAAKTSTSEFGQMKTIDYPALNARLSCIVLKCNKDACNATKTHEVRCSLAPLNEKTESFGTNFQLYSF